MYVCMRLMGYPFLFGSVATFTLILNILFSSYIIILYIFIYIKIKIIKYFKYNYIYNIIIIIKHFYSYFLKKSVAFYI